MKILMNCLVSRDRNQFGLGRIADLFGGATGLGPAPPLHHEFGENTETLARALDIKIFVLDGFQDDRGNLRPIKPGG